MRLGARFLVVCLLLLFVDSALEAGELRTHELASKFIDRTVKLNVLLPNGYDEATKSYPVVYLLHGYGGDYGEWERVGVVERAAGLPVIIAMPEGDQSFYVNLHDDAGNRWEDYITQEVIPFVDGAYRTRAERSGRGVSGLSMGGYGACMLGLRHPELFATVASHSGALGILSGKKRGGIGERIDEVFGPADSSTRKDYDLSDLVKQRVRDGQLPHLYLDCGSQDSFLAANRHFVAELAEQRVAYEYRELPGGHNFDYWRTHVRYSLERQIEVFATTAQPPQVAQTAEPQRAKSRQDGAAAVAGVWDLLAETPDGEEIEIVLTLERDGEKLGGLFHSERGEREIEEASYEDDALRIKIPSREGAWVVLRGKFEDGSLVGGWEIQDKNETVYLRGDWEAARREPVDPPAAEVKVESIAGTWDVVATVPGDDPHEAQWIIAGTDGGYSGRSQTDDRSVGFTEIEFEDDRLVIEFPFGDEGTILVEGRRIDGRLVGGWRLEDRDGGERVAGDWRATRRGETSSGEEKASAGTSAGVVGVWHFEGSLPDGERHEARLYVEKTADGYTGRSESERGNAKFRTTSYQDGELKIEVDIRDGEAVVVLKGRLTDGRLKGRWVLQTGTGTELFNGSWHATRVVEEEESEAATPPVELAGTWDVVALLPNGTKRTSQMILERDGEGYSGRSESEDGPVEYDKVSLNKGVVELTFDLKTEGEGVRIGVRAEAKENRLEGLWTLYNSSGETLASGEWSAVRGQSRRF